MVDESYSTFKEQNMKKKDEPLIHSTRNNTSPNQILLYFSIILYTLHIVNSEGLLKAFNQFVTVKSLNFELEFDISVESTVPSSKHKT